MKSMLWSQSILKEYVKVNYYNIGFDIGNYHFNREKHFAVNLLTHGQTSKSLEHWKGKGLFVCVDSLCPIQQFFSPVEMGLPRLNQY